MKFACLFAFVLATPALAQDAAPAAPSAPVAPKEEKKICRMVDTTGSIMGKRECHTKEEWRKISEANSDRASRALDDRRAGSNGGMNRD